MVHKPEIIEKGWGCEKIIMRHDQYCGKLLCFDKGKSGSFHFHMKKTESFYLSSGKVILYIIDKETSDVAEHTMEAGDCVTLIAGTPHKVTALEDSVIFESSTPDYPDDTYRIGKGDSQK